MADAPFWQELLLRELTPSCELLLLLQPLAWKMRDRCLDEVSSIHFNFGSIKYLLPLKLQTSNFPLGSPRSRDDYN